MDVVSQNILLPSPFHVKDTLTASLWLVCAASFTPLALGASLSEVRVTRHKLCDTVDLITEIRDKGTVIYAKDGSHLG